jgi:dolichol-phosphate hexosyltransferase
VTLLVPCFNEADSIGSVIDQLPRKHLRDAGFSVDVLVVDNASSDATAVVALAHGAAVVHEPRRGKGNAIRTGFYAISDDTDYVVMTDGDGTYSTGEILRLLEPLESGFCDVVLGSRLAGKMTKNSMKVFNRLGNWFFSALIRNVYKVNITDTLTGYFAWRHEVIVQLRPHIVSGGFAIEMEMITKQARLGFDTYSVPITYAPRIGETSLRPIRDGIRILGMFLRQLSWQPGPELAPQAASVICPPPVSVMSLDPAAELDAPPRGRSAHLVRLVECIPVADEDDDAVRAESVVWRAKPALAAVSRADPDIKRR